MYSVDKIDSVDMFGLGEAYFNGSREEEFMRLMSLGMEALSPVDEFIDVHYPGLSDQYSKYLISRLDETRYIAAYRQYKLDKDFMKFEESANNIQFYLQRSDYENLLRSTEPVKRFLFSSMDYQLRGGYFEYELFSGKIEVSPVCVDFSWSSAPQTVKNFLSGLGVVQDTVIYPAREIATDGQLKIATDLYKLSQTLESQENVSILIVGSAAQSMGGGKSYDLLQYMFKNTVVDMYDPHETNDSYVGRNNVSYYRHAEAYQFDAGMLSRDLIQCDAFITADKNMEHLDPDKWLLKARNFSCKKLQGDERYFKGMHGTRQVGRVGTVEERVYKVQPRLGVVRDTRFGSCSFCREMYYYSKYTYHDDFFSALALLHSPSTRCSIRSCYVAPICCGDIMYKGKMMYCVLKVFNPVCLAFDPVLDYERVVNFSMLTDRTYVFSDIRNIQHYMFSAKVAVYDGGRYFVNYEDKDIMEVYDYDDELGGMRFRRVERNLEELLVSADPPIMCHVKNLFTSTKVERGFPLVVASDDQELQRRYKGCAVIAPRDYSMFWKLQRYYGHFYYVYDRGGGNEVLLLSI